MKRILFFAFALLASTIFFGCEEDTAVITTPTPPDDRPPVETTLDFEVQTEVAPNSIRELNMSMAAKNLRPTWIDGFRHKAGNSTQQYDEYLFNVVYTENENNIDWHVFTDLSKTQLEEKLLTYGASGFRALQVESYFKNGNARYAVILEEGDMSEQYFAIAKTSNVYQSIFDDKVADGYRLLSRSVLYEGDERIITAHFGPNDIGSWVAFTTLDEDEIQAKMEENKENGRMAAYLDVAQKGTTYHVRYSPIFTSEPHNNWYALNKLSPEKLEDEIETARNNGYQVTFVCGYDEFGLVNGNEVNFLRYAVGFKK